MAFTRSIDELIKNDKTGLLGKHPSWKRVKLSLIASILNGAPFESSKFSLSEGTPLIRIRDLLTGSTETFYTGEYQDTYLINKGDLLVGMDGDFNSCLWKGATGLLNQRVCKVTIETELYDKKFVNLLLPGYLTSINEHTSSVTVKHLSSKTIGDIDLPLPPRKEQTRIVEKLEELLPQLDAGITELQAAQKKLKQYRQSLLKAAVEGQLTADWRKRNVPTENGAQLLERILSERRSHWEAKQLAKFNEQGKKPPKGWQDKFPEPARPDTTNLPELPEGWVWATVDQISEVHSGSTPKGVENQSTELGEIPWFRVGDMNSTGNEIELIRSRINLTEEATLTLGLKKLPRNTIVFPKRGGAIATNKKRLLNRPSCIDLNMMGIVSNEFLQDWVWTWFQTISLKSLSDGSNVPQINNPDITNLPIPIPPLGEQKEALKNLYELSRENISLSDELHRSHLRASKQRQNILRAAFAGELVPQDPNDEPASELLARIAAERTAKQVSKRVPAERNKATTVEPSGTKRRKRKEAS